MRTPSLGFPFTIVGLLAASACSSVVTPASTSGGTTGTGGSTSSATTTSSAATGGGGSTSTTTTGTTTGTGGGSAACAAIEEAIAKKTQNQGACTTTVRLDGPTRKLLGHHFFCGPYGAVTEAAARVTAQSDTGFGQNGQLLSGSNPPDAFVFYESPGDFGGAAAVAKNTGLSVFGGGIVWGGKGEITYPLDWASPSELGEGCGPIANLPFPQTRGFDLVGGGALSPADVQAVMDVVWSTALPAGLAQGSYFFDSVVLRYPRSVGAVDPASVEWIALINSGWLE